MSTHNKKSFNLHIFFSNAPGWSSDFKIFSIHHTFVIPLGYQSKRGPEATSEFSSRCVLRCWSVLVGWPFECCWRSCWKTHLWQCHWTRGNAAKKGLVKQTITRWKIFNLLGNVFPSVSNPSFISEKVNLLFPFCFVLSLRCLCRCNHDTIVKVHRKDLKLLVKYWIDSIT